MSPHSLRARGTAVVCMTPVRQGTSSIEEAIGLFDLLYNRHAAALDEEPIMKIKELLQTWDDHFAKYGTLADAPRSGRPSLLSNEEAAQLAKVFAAGIKYTPQRPDGSPMQEAHRYFRSIEDGVRSSTTLSEALEKYKITARQLLARMRRAMPELQRVHLQYKLCFTAAQRAARMAAAQQLLRTATLARLVNVLWIDCATINVLWKNGEHDVWLDSSDPQAQLPRTPEEGLGAARCKLKFIMAVHALHGGVYMEQTSGSKALPRSAAFKNQYWRHRNYKVSIKVPAGCPCTTVGLPPTALRARAVYGSLLPPVGNSSEP